MKRHRWVVLFASAITLTVIQMITVAQGTTGPGRNKKPDINQKLVVLLPPHP